MTIELEHPATTLLKEVSGVLDVVIAYVYRPLFAPPLPIPGSG
jgi:hypothetical protein